MSSKTSNTSLRPTVVVASSSTSKGKLRVRSRSELNFEKKKEHRLCHEFALIYRCCSYLLYSSAHVWKKKKVICLLLFSFFFLFLCSYIYRWRWRRQLRFLINRKLILFEDMFIKKNTHTTTSMRKNEDKILGCWWCLACSMKNGSSLLFFFSIRSR